MKTTISIVLLSFCLSFSAMAQSYDDLSTKKVNEGAIGSGYDDLSTKGINEGANRIGL